MVKIILIFTGRIISAPTFCIDAAHQKQKEMTLDLALFTAEIKGHLCSFLVSNIIG